MKKVLSVDDIGDAYLKRMISNVLGRDPLSVLETTPKRLRKLTKGLKKKHLNQAPAPGKWSITQIVTHLADSEVLLAFRLRMVLAQPGTHLQSMDQDKWAAGLRYDRAQCNDQLALFSALRKRHVALWQELTEDEWNKYGVHEERGQETVERMTQHYAGHDINHLDQIRAIRKSFKGKKKKRG